MDMVWNRADGAHAALLLAHGAGVGRDSPFMEGMAARLAMRGVSVGRFEFAYMAGRRTGGPRRPPPGAHRLVAEYLEAVAALEPGPPLLIGGKSLGGRVALMASGEEAVAGRVAGVVCLGYPLHPPGRPDELRLSPLLEATFPVLLCQGDRDPFGSRVELEALSLPHEIELAWLDDGDHDFKPRGRAAATWKANMDVAADAVSAFARRLAGG